MSDILKSAGEAVAIAKGDQPAARMRWNGHDYVPLADYERLREIVFAIAMIDLNACTEHDQALLEDAVAKARALSDAPADVNMGR